jgi:hypothetical protein
MDSRLQQSIRSHTYLQNLSNWFGVTLTFKQRLNGNRLDEISSSQNLRHFTNLLNKRVFGNRSKRFGSKVEIIPVLERSKMDRYHYHLCLRKPETHSDQKFETVIRECWLKTRWGYNEIHIHRQIDNGWVDYITKSDDIDWNNFYRDR